MRLLSGVGITDFVADQDRLRRIDATFAQNGFELGRFAKDRRPTFIKGDTSAAFRPQHAPDVLLCIGTDHGQRRPTRLEAAQLRLDARKQGNLVDLLPHQLAHMRCHDRNFPSRHTQLLDQRLGIQHTQRLLFVGIDAAKAILVGKLVDKTGCPTE